MSADQDGIRRVLIDAERLAARVEELRDENAELRCRVDELAEENKTLTSERDTLLTKISDAHALPSWGGPW